MATKTPDVPRPDSVPRPIEDHGIVGDLVTCALVAKDGTVDFMCWPRFDGPSVFAALLDPEKGGDFTIEPELDDPRHLQRYLPDTNVLVTRWQAEAGSVEVTDLMPKVDGLPGPRLVRQVRVTRGRVNIRVRCRPRFDYARLAVTAIRCDGGVRFPRGDGGPTLRLSACGVPIIAEGTDAVAHLTLSAGESVDFVLDGGDGPTPDRRTAEQWFRTTVDYWRAWTGKSSYKGRWREAVNRSALVMKLLTSAEYHSILAAATFGLPEASGAGRNWDYRATWIRDASFTVYAFLRLGYQDEAVAFMEWVNDRVEAADGSGRIQIMYGLDGRADLPEQTLDHLAGYGGATPVRIGNAAHTQLQLDIYGELLDTGYLVNKYARGISHDRWGHVVNAVGYVCKHWDDPDAGIWEKRGKPQHFLHSRVMSWVAVDRAVRLANKRSLPAPTVEWERVRTKIYADVHAHFWNAELNHFVAVKGGTTLDASLLMLPLVRFCSATDPRWLSTLDAIGSTLVDDGLVYRYLDDDGLDGQEGGFLACSFWYAECLARAGRLWEARQAFERALSHANHLTLYAEEAGKSGQFLGNFPQVLTHLALISAAYYIDRELAGDPATEWRP